MAEIIFFGASEGSILIGKTLNHTAKVAAILENNRDKWGKMLKGIEIIGPHQLQDYSYDYVIITNRHGADIRKQLTEKYQVPNEKILDVFMGEMFDNRVGILRLMADLIYQNNIKGNVAELGVYRGEFASYMNEAFKDKKLYLFDTFTGFNNQDCDYDRDNKYSEAQEMDFSDTNICLVMDKMAYPENVVPVQGFFPQSLQGMEDEFCFVSLDADLYIPIYNGLQYFYPRLQSGGYIIIHDYNSTTYTGTKEAVDTYCSENSITLIPMIDKCGSAIIAK